MKIGLPRKVRRQISYRRGFGIVDGIKVPLDPAFVAPSIAKHIAQGSYEGTEAQVLAHVLRPDDCVLELGGGLGFISSFTAQRVPEGTVHVYEANPDLIPLIEKTHALNGVTATLTNAVLGPGEARGRAAFHKRAEFWASSLDPSAPGVVETVEVDVLGLDTVLASVRPTVLVFDIEGGEYDLFRGAQLHGVRAVVGEFHPLVLGHGRVTEIVQNFLNQGFLLNTSDSDHTVLLFERG